ncbi:MAG: 4Fe-4S dicluster domain-containing protein [Desulfurococcaceae archaeon]
MGDESHLDKLMKYLVETMKLHILGYRFENNRIIWGEINGIVQLPLDIEDYVEPGHFRLRKGRRFRHSWFSPKIYLYPSEQIFISDSRDFKESKTPKLVEYDRVSIFGIKTCDLEAIKILDSMLLYKHPIYTARRESVSLIVVEECLEPNNNCFCAITGTGPLAIDGFDIAFARLEPGKIIFKYGSKIGEEILRALNLLIAGKREVSTYFDKAEKAVIDMRKKIPIDINGIQGALSRSIHDSLIWSKISENCTGCGNCNFVCPTCFCMEMIYSIENMNTSSRVGKWTGCLLFSYGLVAGMHFRPELYMRFRHFILHKFMFYPKQIGRIGCVGCGRCITWCPMKVDQIHALRKLIEGFGKVE